MPLTFPLGALVLEIAEADIAAQAVNAVVNAANSALWMGSGVAGALKARGGVEIEREAMAQGPIAPGGAVLTGAGALPATHVIHAAAMGEDLETSVDLVARATESALAEADSHGLASIAFPALGTGVGGLGLDRCAATMVEVFVRYAARPGSVRLIRLVLFGQTAYQVFADVARDRLGTR